MTTTEQLAPEQRLAESRRKIRAPFTLDPSMCFYSPQANLDALTHPRVAEWLEYVRREWAPTPVPGARGRLALLLPCTKYKPYVTSREHRAVNAALLEAGWKPLDSTVPAELAAVVEATESPDVLAVAPLERGGIVLDRFVISEPLALVPYELSIRFRDEQSPATSYDDPGMFESRGTSVSPERPDCTAVQTENGWWRWGPAERQAYAEMHNAMASFLADALGRLRPAYGRMFAWVSPGLTHRSFLADSDFRAADGLPVSRQGGAGEIALTGALDHAPGAVDIMPTRAHIDEAREQLALRLAAEGRHGSAASARAIYARGDGNDTPLGLPELLSSLVAELDGAVGTLR